jgi:hypothetical protein
MPMWRSSPSTISQSVNAESFTFSPVMILS